jgi:hypothetical protein
VGLWSDSWGAGRIHTLGVRLRVVLERLAAGIGSAEGAMDQGLPRTSTDSHKYVDLLKINRHERRRA